MMSVASGLLRLLGGESSSRSPAPAGHGSRELDFAALLDKARAGEIHSGRAITVAPDAGVKLSEDQLLQLAAAADLAEAQGATRALVLIDGQALRLDITLREVTEAVSLGGSGIFTNIDAVLSIPSTESPDQASILPPPGDGKAWTNASLLSALAQGESRSHTREAH